VQSLPEMPRMVKDVGSRQCPRIADAHNYT
jgi:hypothetical protein